MARLLSEFHLNLPEDYKVKIIQSTTVKPADDVPCTLQRISNNVTCVYPS